MKLEIDLTPEMEKMLLDRTQRTIRDMTECGYDFNDWSPKLEAITILRVALEKEAAGE